MRVKQVRHQPPAPRTKIGSTSRCAGAVRKGAERQKGTGRPSSIADWRWAGPLFVSRKAGGQHRGASAASSWSSRPSVTSSRLPLLSSAIASPSSESVSAWLASLPGSWQWKTGPACEAETPGADGQPTHDEAPGNAWYWPTADQGGPPEARAAALSTDGQRDLRVAQPKEPSGQRLGGDGTAPGLLRASLRVAKWMHIRALWLLTRAEASLSPA